MQQEVYGKPLVYLDNAATSQKPLAVIEALSNYYATINSNVHRGVHYLSQQATDAFEGARGDIRRFINARHTHEVVITKGATDSINLVAYSFGKRFIGKGDEVIVSMLEHHSNVVPWQMVCEERGAVLKVIPVKENLELDLEAFGKLLTDRTKIVAVGHISNAIGIVNPIAEIIRMAHERGIPVMVDGAQGIVHRKVDVQALDCDFYCFSSHKFYGPMGLGVLYGKEKWLLDMPPYQTGGEMIRSVSFEKTSFNDLPFKFESGTPNVADAIGFKAAIQYMEDIGLDEAYAYEDRLLEYAGEKLGSIDGMEILGEGTKSRGDLV